MALIYKYCPTERIDTIIQRRIRFTQPSLFNDIFESWPVAPIQSNDAESRLDAIYDDALGQEPILGYQPEHSAELIRETGRIIESMLGLRAVQLARKAIDEEYGILCLSANPTSLLMWGHYASDHRGYAIGFDSNHKWFRAYDEETAVGCIHPVQYSPDRPAAASDQLTYLDYLFKKSIEWSYEREWRIVRPLQDGEILPDTNPPVVLFQFPIDSVRRVVFGGRMSREDKDRIASAIEAQTGAGSVELAVARPDSRYYRLNLLEFESGEVLQRGDAS
jgi:hypothetical protein